MSDTWARHEHAPGEMMDNPANLCPMVGLTSVAWYLKNMAEYSKALEWIFQMPSGLGFLKQAEYLEGGLTLARESGNAEDVALLQITLGQKLCLADRPEDALKAIEAVEIPKDRLREELPRYLANVYKHLGNIDRSLELIFTGFEGDEDERMTPLEHEEYKRRRIEAVWTAALGGAEKLRLQLQGMEKDVDRGYSFIPSEYPVSEETLFEASDGLFMKEWLRRTILPMHQKI